MPARRFFAAARREIGETVPIEGGDAHKIAHVLRLRSGDRIELIDSAAQCFDARLDIQGDRVLARLETLVARAPVQRVQIDVAQGVPKGSKMDYVVEKLGELGVRALVPLRSERTIAADVSPAKLERWQRLAKSASAQSGRHDVLRVEEPVTLAALLGRAGDYDRVLFAWEAAAEEPLGLRLPGLLASAARLLLVIGPEGGFSHPEAEAAQAAGAVLISLGPRVLRTETAALAAVAVLWYELERLAGRSDYTDT